MIDAFLGFTQLNNSLAQLTSKNLWNPAKLAPLVEPRLLHWQPKMAQLAGLSASSLDQQHFLQYISGTPLPPTFQPIACAYAGHQFGRFHPALGDGRTLLLGDLEHQNKPWSLQLKGSGTTPYSRNHDGRLSLRAALKEYLNSAALFGLGINSANCLALITSRSHLKHPQNGPAAMLLRAAPNFLRFGSFEYCYAHGDQTGLKALLNFATQQDTKQCGQPANYSTWLKTQIETSAKAVAHWQAQGFAHATLNSDNHGLDGLALDIGQGQFIGHFAPNKRLTHDDERHRYSLLNQPRAAYFNCQILAQCLTSLIGAESAAQALASFWQSFSKSFYQLMSDKLGLGTSLAGDAQLIDAFLILLERYNLNYPKTFLTLTQNYDNQGSISEPLGISCSEPWLEQYQLRITKGGHSPHQRLSTMLKANPKITLSAGTIDTVFEDLSAGSTTSLTQLCADLHQPFSA